MRRHRKGKILLCVTLTGLLLIPAMAAAVLRPKLAVYAENYVQYQATSKMEHAVASCADQMEEIGTLHRDETGAVTALTTNSAAVNRIRTQLVQRVYDEIGALEHARTSVALGTLVDPQLLTGFGPQIPFGVVSLGCVMLLLGTVAVKLTDCVPMRVLPLYVLHVSVPVPLALLGICTARS